MEGSGRNGTKIVWLAAIGLAAVVAGIILIRLVGADDEPARSQADRLRATAQDRSAQSVLRNAMTAARFYYTDTETYDGFTPPTAEQIDPNVTWMDGRPASVGIVSIDLAEGSSVVMSTLSASGQAFCIADEEYVVLYGSRDATGARSARDCGTGSGW